MRRLPPHLGRRLVRGELIVPLAVGVLVGLGAGVIGFGVPGAAVFGKPATGWSAGSCPGPTSIRTRGASVCTVRQIGPRAWTTALVTSSLTKNTPNS